MVTTDSDLLQSSYQCYTKTAGPTLPPDTFFPTMITSSHFDYPKQPASNKSFGSEAARLFGSFDNSTSVSSSTTSASSAWTSPNTSFSSRSLASFDASVDGTERIEGGSWGHLSRPPLSNVSPSRSDSDVAKWHESEASKVLTDNATAPFDPMDLDAISTSRNQNVLEAEPLYLPGQIEARTSETEVGKLLALRLQVNSPFGKRYPLPLFCLSVLIF